MSVLTAPGGGPGRQPSGRLASEDSAGPTTPDAPPTRTRRYRPRRRSSRAQYGFFTDTSVCIGCKACEVACKQWNQLPMDTFGFTASATTTRRRSRPPPGGTWPSSRAGRGARGRARWLFMSDVCKHCDDAGCLEACPTGAIFAPSSAPSWCSRTSAMAASYCVPAARSAWSTWPRSWPPRSRRAPIVCTSRSRATWRTSAPSATTDWSTASSPPAPRPARPTRSSSAPRRAPGAGRTAGGRAPRARRAGGVPLRRAGG